MEIDNFEENNQYMPESPIDVGPGTEDIATSRLAWLAVIGKRTVESTVVFIEANPLISEVSRYALLGATYAATKNPAYAAGAYAGSTLVLQGSASYAASDLITSKNGSKTVNWLGAQLDKTPLRRLLRPGQQPSLINEGLIATYLGTSFQLAILKKKLPDITKDELRKHGNYGVAYLTALTFTEGDFITEGVKYITDPYVSVSMGLAIGGLAATKRYIKNRRLKQSEDV